MSRRYPRILFGLLAGLSLCPGYARSAGWVAMDWIDGWYETSTPALRQELSITRATINCKNLTIRTTPQACIDWIRAHPTSGITQYVPYINVSLSRIENDARLYSQYSVGSPVSEVDFDDFFVTYVDWYKTKGTGTAAFLSRVIDNFKSVNPNLKFGIVLYENQLDPQRNPYIDSAHLPSTVRAKINVVRLYLHFRANGLKYATYVTQVKALFPNAQIIAGVYGYDRIDYLSCTEANRTVFCTQAEELNYFQQTLNIQLQLLKQGTVAELDFYPGYFGAETKMYGTAPDSINLKCSNVTRCVQNTITMRDMIRSARASFQSTTPPPPPPSGTAPMITRQPTNTLLQVGQTQIFSVTATGSTPLTYQWRRNGVSISGATLASYHTPPVSTTDHNAAYSCVVRNAYGQVTSGSGIITLSGSGTAPVITRQPTNTDLSIGQTQIFSVAATGSAPLTYQWRRNGVSISGATLASYHTPPVTSADNNAAYTCVVRNTYGQVTSAPGVVRLISPAPAFQVEAIAEPAAAAVYPNPWRGDRHGALAITFKDVAAGSIVKIFTVSAHAVRTLFSSGDSVTWDRKNDSGDPIASGLYIYLITNTRGQQIRGKLAVIN